MMKLNYIANLRLPTEKAYGIQIAKMCEAFTGQNIKVGLTAPFRFNRIKDDFFKYYGVKNNFSFRKIPSPDFYLPGNLDKLAFGLKSFISASILVAKALGDKADIYYFRDELPAFLASFLIGGARIAFEAHKFSNRKLFLYRRFRKSGVRLIAITQNLADRFLEIGFNHNQILVAADGVDLDKFDIEISREDARLKLGLPLDKKIAVYTGHLFEWKGADILAETASELPDILFVFVGGTDKDIARFKERFRSQDNILIVGHRPYSQIPLYLKAADVLVLPNPGNNQVSRLYTSPLKLFEYMAAKRPIVASNLPSVREILNEENSILVKPESNSIGEGIRKVFSEPGLAVSLAGQAFKKAGGYTWTARAEKILKFINGN